MDRDKTGRMIRRLRTERGLTQRGLAERLHVGDKAVSKWERGAGCPDISLLPELARLLGVSAESLLAGDLNDNPNDGGNMKRIKVYQCPVCGNLLTATGEATLACCGRSLAPLVVQPADAAHRLTVAPVEDEWYVTWSHPMAKEHHLSFLLEVGYDRIVLVRLYAEGGCEARLPRLPGGRIYAGCSRDGFFAQ